MFAPTNLLLAATTTFILCLQQQVAGQQNGSQPAPTTTTARPNYLETGRQITGILDRFMSLGYDKRVRPNYGGPPVEVNVTMRILSISSVSEVMMDFTADFYFRQTWHDPRLSFKKLGDIQTLYVGAEVSKKIWLPDTFFGNEKLAYFHEATTPNVFLRIDHSGEVYRSIRLTVTSSCPMNLQYFPMDRQRCTIEAESYGYNVKDIIYRWARKDTAVERDKEISLPQFDIVKTVQKYRLEELSSGTYSRLIAEIHFARRMGYYLIQIYIPSSLIVVISWVSFWLHRNASPARVQLGVTTVLTMTTLMSSTNAALPKISYVKSIDIFLGTCFVMVFAALLEYATVGYLGKRIAMRKAQMQHAKSQAQARIFAQLQAQGASGADPMPASSTSAAAIFGSEPITSISTAAATAAMQAQPSPALLPGGGGGGGIASIDMDQVQQAALLQHLIAAAAAASSSVAPSTPEPATPIPPPRSTNERPRCGHAHLHNNGHTHGHHHRQHFHLAHHTHSCANLAAAKSPGGGPSNGCADCTCRQSPESPANCCHRTSQMRGQQRSMMAGQVSCACEGTQTLPSRNLAAPVSSPGQCSKCSQANSGGQVSFQSQPQLQQPPIYGNKGATAAAAAAAAAFVNMHRRQKGLPPSKNPNFAQFNWPGSHNLNSETIFGVRPSDIDKYSRVIFPVCFVCFQLMYWIVYLHISAFLESELQPPPT